MNKKIEISPIALLRKALSETENGSRLRTTTRNDIKGLIDRIDSGRIINEQTTARLLDMLKLGFAAEKLTDRELADWLIKEVHADMAVDSIEHALVWEAIRRLETEGMMLKIFEGVKIKKVGGDTLDMVRRLGKDISFTEADRHVEAYEYRDHVYIASIQPAGPRE